MAEPKEEPTITGTGKGKTEEELNAAEKEFNETESEEVEVEEEPEEVKEEPVIPPRPKTADEKEFEDWLLFGVIKLGDFIIGGAHALIYNKIQKKRFIEYSDARLEKTELEDIVKKIPEKYKAKILDKYGPEMFLILRIENMYLDKLQAKSKKKT